MHVLEPADAGDLAILQRPHGDFSAQGAFQASPFQEAMAPGFTEPGLRGPPPRAAGWRGESKSALKKEKQSWGCRPCYTGLRLSGGGGRLKPVPEGASLIQHRHEGPPNLYKEPPFQGHVAASANVNWSEHRFSVFTPKSPPTPIPPLDSQSQTPSFRPLSCSLPLCFHHPSLEAHCLALPNAPCSCPPHTALTRGSLVSSQKCPLMVSRPVILKMVPDQQQHLRTCQNSSSRGCRRMDQKT